MSRHLKHYLMNVAVSFLSFTTAVYLVELSLILSEPLAVFSYDSRSKYEIVMDERESGNNIYPTAYPKHMKNASLALDGRPIVPLAGVAEVRSLLCTVRGKAMYYQSDKYGFHNPSAAWDGPVDVDLVGDSYAQGQCIPDPKNFAALLRPKFKRMINTSISGNGPLIQLATLREYVEPLAPPEVIWFYFEGNDMKNLSDEMLAPVLKNYLTDKDFKQNLRENSQAVDRVVREYVEQAILTEKQQATGKILRVKLKELVKLRNLKERFRQFHRVWLRKSWEGSHHPGVDRKDLMKAYYDIMEEANTRISGWGGRLYFVYLPAWDQFGSIAGPLENSFKPDIMRIVQRLGLPVLDLSKDFIGSGDPLQFFPYRSDFHYNEAGNRLVAKKILEFLAAESKSRQN